MMSEEKESKKPLFQCIHEKVSMKWKGFSEKTQTFIGIGLIILLGCIACSPILIFSSKQFLSSIPIFYKILVFLVFSVLFLFYFFKWTIKNVAVLSKTLKTFYSWDDAIAVLLFIYGIYSFSMQPTLGFLEEFRAELIGAGIATLLIGNASQAAQIREEKKRLILQMGSPDNSFAIEAVRQLSQQGWLKDGTLKRADLHKANLNGANLWGANLRRVDLHSASLSKALLWAANLSEAWLTKAILNGVKLFGATLSRANLQSANLSGTDLRLANLSEASMLEVNLSGAKLKKANLSGADLEKANLSGADFRGVTLSETTIFADAFYTKGEYGTVFPEGFNPTDHGMHLINEGESYEEAVKRVFLNQ